MLMKKLFAGLLLVGGLLFVESVHPIHDEVLRSFKASIAHMEKTAKFINSTQIACMATNMIYEAGSEGVEGMAAVARVVLNRIAHGFATTPCKVIYQKTVLKGAENEIERIICQFSWTCQEVPAINKRDPNYALAEKIAFDVLANNAYNDLVSKNTVYFHATSVKPNWPYKRDRVIGNHIFYTKHRIKQ